jgi:hypothetical protein
MLLSSRLSVRLATHKRAVAVFLAASFFGACAGAQHVPVQLPPPVIMTPERYAVPASAQQLADLQLDGIRELERAFASVRLQVIDHGLTPFDPASANRGHAASDFAFYMTTQESTLSQDVHHILFVVPEPWTGDRVDRFIQAYYAMPGMTPREAGVPFFHFVSAEPPPFALQYLFGNAWWGALESLLLADFADMSPDLNRIDHYRALSIQRFSEFGLVFDTPEASLASLEYLLANLPRDPELGSYRPIGTLAGIGLLFGEVVRHQFPEMHWADAQPVMATLFAMHSDDSEDVYLRPIDYVLQAWQQSPGTPLADYLQLLRSRLNESSAESATRE